MKRLNSQSGFSIVSTLMVSVVLVGVAAGLIAVVITMFRSGTRQEAENAADEALGLVQLILSNKAFSSNALQTYGGTPIPFNAGASSIEINVINLQNATGGSGPLKALVEGQMITPKLKLSSMAFQPATVPATGTAININGTGYKAYSGLLLLKFSESTDFIGGTLKPRQLAVTVLVGDSTNTIDLCYESVSGQQVCQQIGGTLDPATNQCKNTIFDKLTSLLLCSSANADVPCPTPYPPGQGGFYAVTGFDSNGKPICTCTTVPIVAEPPPPPPAPPPPAPGPFPNPAGPGPAGFGGGY